MPPKRVTRGRKKADETVDEDFDASGLETSGSETESEIDDSSEEDQSFIDVSFFRHSNLSKTPQFHPIQKIIVHFLRTIMILMVMMTI